MIEAIGTGILLVSMFMSAYALGYLRGLEAVKKADTSLGAATQVLERSGAALEICTRLDSYPGAKMEVLSYCHDQHVAFDNAMDTRTFLP